MTLASRISRFGKLHRACIGMQSDAIAPVGKVKSEKQLRLKSLTVNRFINIKLKKKVYVEANSALTVSAKWLCVSDALCQNDAMTLIILTGP